MPADGWQRDPIDATEFSVTAGFERKRRGLVELRGIEPLTSAVRLQRSPI